MTEIYENLHEGNETNAENTNLYWNSIYTQMHCKFYFLKMCISPVANTSYFVRWPRRSLALQQPYVHYHIHKSPVIAIRFAPVKFSPHIYTQFHKKFLDQPFWY
jgi:hypothetical protein